MQSRDLYWLLVIVLLTGVAIWVVVAPNDRFLGRDVHTRLGLDLQGGIQVLLSAVKSEDEEITREEMEVAAGVIERRVNAFGVGETVVQVSGSDRVIVELPGVEDPQQAIETIRGTGSLEFVDPMGQFLTQGQIVRTANNPEPLVLQLQDEQEGSTAPLTATGEVTTPGEHTPTDGITPSTGVLTPAAQTPPTAPQVLDTIFPVIAEGKDLVTSAVQPVLSDSSGLGAEPAVSFEFRDESKAELARFSSTHIGDPMCIVLDNTVVSCPVIQAALTEGEGIITTGNMDDRDRIYKQLKFGALPIPFQVETSRTVTATLGRDSVNDSMVAGTVGLAVVALFMLLYYRLPGFLAVIALFIYTVMSFALYRLIPVTLTLAGIAGFVLSIGLAVDANVLIFARLKEELRRKKRLATAIEDGFREAWPAIRDSSVSTLITSTILYIFGNSFGVSIIKGFALTLGLGILVSLFTAMVITRTLLRLIVPLGIAQNLWFFEIDTAAPSAASPNPKVSPSE